MTPFKRSVGIVCHLNNGAPNNTNTGTSYERNTVALFDPQIVSFAGYRQNFITSSDTGVTWMPCRNATRAGFSTSSIAYVAFSPSFLVSLLAVQAAAVSTNGGDSYELRGLVSNGTVIDDASHAVSIRSADLMYRATNYTDIARITDSCRSWTIIKTPIKNQEFLLSDSIRIWREIHQVQALTDSTLIILLLEYRHNLKDQRTVTRWYVYRSDDYFKNTDTLLLSFNDLGGHFRFTSREDGRFYTNGSPKDPARILRTKDGGNSWVTEKVDSVERYFVFAAEEVENREFVRGNQGVLEYTEDSAHTWKRFKTADSTSKLSILKQFSNGFAIASGSRDGNSCLYKIVRRRNVNSSVTESLCINSDHPRMNWVVNKQPANDHVDASLFLPLGFRSENANVELYDIRGAFIQTIEPVSQELTNDGIIATYSCSTMRLPSGVYILQAAVYSLSCSAVVVVKH